VYSTLTRSPSATYATTVTFSFAASDVARFRCQLLADDALRSRPLAECTSPKTLARLPAGNYTFLVQPVYPAGVTPPPVRSRRRAIRALALHASQRRGHGEGFASGLG